MAQDEYVAIALNRLPIGQKVRQPILDKEMQVLVEGEYELSADTVGRLQYHQIRAYVHRDDREAWGLASVGGPTLIGPATEATPTYLAFPKQLPPAMPGLLQFVQERVSSLAATGGTDPKSDFRYSLALPVPLQAIDKGFKPVDEPFMAVIRDLSSTFVGLTSARAPRTENITLNMRLPGKPGFQLVCYVQRCDAVGRYYDLTCRIQSRIAAETKSDAIGTSAPAKQPIPAA